MNEVAVIVVNEPLDTIVAGVFTTISTVPTLVPLGAARVVVCVPNVGVIIEVETVFPLPSTT